MSFLRKNFAYGELAAGISDSDVQLTLESWHTLPVSVGNFRLTIWDYSSFPDPANDPNLEIVTASYSGTPHIYDIVRAQENTAAVAHSSGSKAALHYTAGMSEDDLYESSDFNSDFSSKTLDDLDAGTTNVHLTTTLKSYYDNAYSHSQILSGNPHNVTPQELHLVIGTDVQAQTNYVPEYGVIEIVT